MITFSREELKSKVRRKRKRMAGITNTTMQLNIPPRKEQNMGKQITRLVTCGTGNLHIFTTCPHCYSTRGGILFATVAGTFTGATTAKCVDCSETFDYYIDARAKSIWRMEISNIKKSDILW